MKRKQKKGEEIKTHLEFLKWIKTATPKKKNKLIKAKKTYLLQYLIPKLKVIPLNKKFKLWFIIFEKKNYFFIF